MAGLALKTRVFAAVRATNLDKRYGRGSKCNHFPQQPVVTHTHLIVVPTEARHFYRFSSLFYAMLMFILSLCYYFSRAPVYSLDLSCSHVQLAPILHPISQFCPSAGGTSWWTTVTQPPLGILMMNSAMTFSFGNLPFRSFLEILTR